MIKLIKNLVFLADEIERRSKLCDKMEQLGNQWNKIKGDFFGVGIAIG